WEFHSESHSISISEDQLVDWYFQKEICNHCGVPNQELQTWGTAWDTPKLCHTCYQREDRLYQANFHEWIDTEQVERDYQSQIITQQGIFNICENCNERKKLNNVWEIYHEYNSFCSLVGNKCHDMSDHHMHNVCDE